MLQFAHMMGRRFFNDPLPYGRRSNGGNGPVSLVGFSPGDLLVASGNPVGPGLTYTGNSGAFKILTAADFSQSFYRPEYFEVSAIKWPKGLRYLGGSSGLTFSFNRSASHIGILAFASISPQSLRGPGCVINNQSFIELASYYSPPSEGNTAATVLMWAKPNRPEYQNGQIINMGQGNGYVTTAAFYEMTGEE